MSQQKKQNNSPWVECNKCQIKILSKDTDLHLNDCPILIKNYNFIKNDVLYGITGVKTNDDIKGVVEKDSMVFISEYAIQLCNFSIGEWVSIRFGCLPPIAKVVWPTVEKTSSSVLFTKNVCENNKIGANSRVSVGKLPENVPEASRVILVILNDSKSLEMTPELHNRIHKTHLDHYYSMGSKINIMFFGKVLRFEIKSIETKRDFSEDILANLQLNGSFYKIVPNTIWQFYRSGAQGESININPLSKIGGVDKEIHQIQECIEACLNKSKKKYGLKYGKSILLYGTSGTGKTAIATAIAETFPVHVIKIFSCDLYVKHTNNPEDIMRSLFKEAMDHTPSIIILDEVDLFCPIRSQRMTDSEKRIVSTLTTLFDDFNQTADTFIIGTTNKLDSIDPGFRRYGRFDREIEIPTPTPKNREEILRTVLQDAEHNLTQSDFENIALNTHGFVGADLVSLCSMAGLQASKKNCEHIALEDFQTTLKFVKPSAMREVQVDVANVRWSDIGGQDTLKLMLKQAVEWPIKHPDSFIRLGVTPPKGVLMFGPPGCSKTMIAKAFANESGLNFLSIKGPELFSKWVGESERAVREVFRKARQVAPSIIFFDEIDALGGERSSGSSSSVQERVLAQLLTEMDGISPMGDVTILAATNRPDRIDNALLRPGRLDRIVYVPLPDVKTRLEIFKIKLEKIPVQDVDLHELIIKTEGYSGAEINAVCHEAGMKALEEDLNAQFLTKEHFNTALKMITPRTSFVLLDLYSKFQINRS